MNFNLRDKIEEIRKKPEHIKIRYVWGSVAISMLFIIIIWIFSWQTAPAEKKTGDNFGELKNSFKELNKGVEDAKNIAPSLESALENASPEQPPSEIESQQ